MTGDFIDNDGIQSDNPHPDSEAVKDWIREWDERAKKAAIPPPDSDEVQSWLENFGKNQGTKPTTEPEFPDTLQIIVDPLTYRYSNAPSALIRRFHIEGEEGPFIPEETDRQTAWRYEISQRFIGTLLADQDEQERKGQGEDINSAPIDIKTIIQAMTQNYMRIIQKNSIKITRGERQIGDLTFFDIHDLYCVLENMLFFARGKLDTQIADADNADSSGIQKELIMQDILAYTGLMNTIGTYIIDNPPNTQQSDHHQSTV